MRNFWQIKIRKICRKYATIFDEKILIAYWSGLAAGCRSRRSLWLSSPRQLRASLYLSTTIFFPIFSTTRMDHQILELLYAGGKSRLRTLIGKDGLPTSELAPGCTIPQHNHGNLLLKSTAKWQSHCQCSRSS